MRLDQLQPGYEMSKNLHEVLLKASYYSNELQTVMGFYGNDFEPTQFLGQLQLLSAHFRSLGKQEKVSFDIVEHLQSLSPAAQMLYSQVIVAVSLVLVMPATNAASERSFSSFCRAKSCLRSTMTQLRLNNTMVLYVHRDLTDNLNLIDIANDFVSNKLDHRSSIFDKFSYDQFCGINMCSPCGNVTPCNMCN